MTPASFAAATAPARPSRARRTPPGRRLPTAERRQQIIDTARTVFATQGFRGATTRAIAAAAGVTEAVIFHHFPDKSALYAAILEQKAVDPADERWFAELQTAREAGDDTETLRVLYTGILRQHRDDPAHMRLMMYASLEGHPVAPRLLARGRRLYDFLEQWITERQRLDRFRCGTPALLVRTVLALPIYYVLQRQLFKTPWPAVDPHEVVAEGVQIALAGLVAPSKPAQPSKSFKEVAS
jgi:AcrR family transcriptional regulator